jgi:rhomboid protease GluP
MGDSNHVAVTTAVAHTDPKARKEQICDANFVLGEWHLIKGEKEDARSLFSKAESECPPNFFEYDGAVWEMKRLK